MTDEEWRDVRGFEGLYEVSDLGKVRNSRRLNILKTHPDRDGYLRVRLSNSGAVFNKRVHRLVCEAFHGPAPEGRPWALHGEGGVSDNTPANLEWGDAVRNAKDRTVRDKTDSKKTQTKCVHGHEFVPENTRIRKNGTRVCKACHRERAKTSYRKRRPE